MRSIMKTQTIDRSEKPAALRIVERSSKEQDSQVGTTSLSLPWNAMGDVQQALQPTLNDWIQPGLAQPTSASKKYAVSNDELSVEQVIKLVRHADTLKTKKAMLKAYVSARAAKLSAEDVIALAQNAHIGEAISTFSEKESHDDIIVLWVASRLSNDTLSFADLLKAADEVFEYGRADQMLLLYVRRQDPPLDQRIHLAAMAAFSETAGEILEGVQGR